MNLHGFMVSKRAATRRRRGVALPGPGVIWGPGFFVVSKRNGINEAEQTVS